MKLYFLFLLTIFHGSTTAYNKPKSTDPLIVIILMVKNEEHVMQPTLQPYIDAGIDAYVILDTGSTDNTIHITQNLFQQHNIDNGHIFEQPFIDFAVSRNYALECAEKTFPRAQFFLMIDAEWYMHNVPGLIQFCQNNQNCSESSFLLLMRDCRMETATQRLFKAQAGIRYEGAVHEAPNQITTKRVPNNIYFELSPSHQGIEKSKQRWVRDKEILLKEYDKDPTNLRTIFYLAQTYACLQDYENACLWYHKRCEQHGWDEEDFMAYYKLAQAYESLKKWNTALFYYLEAYNLRPHRAEPLVCIAAHYWQTHNFHLAFMFAQKATTITYPTNDNLFVESIMYHYTRYDILGCAAWYVHEYEIGKNAILNALTYNPYAQHLISNLMLYLQTMKT